MTKPWDETWYAATREVLLVEAGPGREVVEQIAQFFGVGVEAEARMRLAACAPEAFRLLLDPKITGEDGLGGCHWCGIIPPSAHRTNCAWLALMRKAGVLP